MMKKGIVVAVAASWLLAGAVQAQQVGRCVVHGQKGTQTERCAAKKAAPASRPQASVPASAVGPDMRSERLPWEGFVPGIDMDGVRSLRPNARFNETLARLPDGSQDRLLEDVRIGGEPYLATYFFKGDKLTAVGVTYPQFAGTVAQTQVDYEHLHRILVRRHGKPYRFDPLEIHDARITGRADWFLPEGKIVIQAIPMRAGMGVLQLVFMAGA